jgi:hypothetical protein
MIQVSFGKHLQRINHFTLYAIRDRPLVLLVAVVVHLPAIISNFVLL